MPLDVEKINCDLLSATARKYLRGPRGIGFLYVRSAVLAQLHPPMIDLFSASWTSQNEYVLRPDARRFENWENNYAAKLGLGACVDYALDIGLDAIQVRIDELAGYLRANLKEINGIRLHSRCPRQCGIVSFAIEGRDSGEMVREIVDRGVNVSSSSPSSTLIDATRNNLPVLIRASVHYYNDLKEINRLLEIVSDLSG